MPCRILVGVAQGINFLQVVNTTLYATTMDNSNDSSLKIHNSHIHTCFYIFYLAILFISNCKHDFHDVYTCKIVYLVHYGLLNLIIV
jgi:hypothetical protein